MNAYKYAMIENMVTVMACAFCVVGLAAFTSGYWGWGFLILLNCNTVSTIKKTDKNQLNSN